MEYDVFISYSHTDKATADAICASLEQGGIRCWYAPRDILPGSDWAASIMRAIESVRVMVLVYTDDSNISRQVLNEISNAVNSGTVIVPFRLTESPPSKGLQYYFASVHWLDAVNEPLEKSIEKLRLLIRGILSAESVPAGAETPVPAKKKPKRAAWIPAAAAAVLVLAAALAFLWPRTPAGTPAAPDTPAETEAPAAAALPWPETGVLRRSEEAADGPVEIVFRFQQKEDKGTLVKVYKGADQLIATVFAAGEKEVSLSVPVGWYSMDYIFLESWPGMDEALASEGYVPVYFDNSGSDMAHLVEEAEGYIFSIYSPLQ